MLKAVDFSLYPSSNPTHYFKKEPNIISYIKTVLLMSRKKDFYKNSMIFRRDCDIFENIWLK